MINVIARSMKKYPISGPLLLSWEMFMPKNVAEKPNGM
jgi:hypothetical protein